MYDVVALGELLIDFSTSGKGKMNNPCFEMNPGGAPANCLAAIARLSGTVAFIGTVGNDYFGDFLIGSLQDIGIETGGIGKINRIPTTMAFVTLDENGERSFLFVRKPGADIMLSKKDINLRLIDDAKIFHFGSLSLTDEPAREATLFAVQYAKDKGKTVSFDPNYRMQLWPDKQTAVKFMKLGLEYADIVKMSEEEMELITGINRSNFEKGAVTILNMNKKAVFITAGERGAFYATPDESGFVEGYRINAVDTTGCGDAFFGAVLYFLSHKPSMPINEIVRFANAAGALCATKFGGIPAMPGLNEILEL